jgi:hypothetical protein
VLLSAKTWLGFDDNSWIFVEIKSRNIKATCALHLKG